MTDTKEQKLRILIVDDNEMNLKVAAHMADVLGFECAVAKSGRRALMLVETLRFDFILMDCQMPEMDGFETTGRIRQYEGKNHHSIIIAVTAVVAEPDKERCLQAGMDDYIAKPLRLESLQKVIDFWTAKKKGIASEYGISPAVIHSDEGVPVLDRNRFEELQQIGDPLFLREVITQFTATVQQVQADAPGAVAAGDFGALRMMGHKLRGASITLGAKAMAHRAAAIEQAAKEEDANGITRHLGGMEDELRQLLEVLYALGARP